MFGHDDSTNNSHHTDPLLGSGTAAPAASTTASSATDTPLPTPSAPPVSHNPVDDLLSDTPKTPDASSSDVPSVPANPADDELLNIKQQALQQLSPLVGHLDQTPEERFRTTMMLIQAADNKSLLKEAYEAAQGIPDEKVRAQALLDVVNEINYFTQQHETDDHAS